MDSLLPGGREIVQRRVRVRGRGRAGRGAGGRVAVPADSHIRGRVDKLVIYQIAARVDVDANRVARICIVGDLQIGRGERVR
jgi:hypothetical protein